MGCDRLADRVVQALSCRPPAYLADVLTRIVNGHLAHDIDELLPWAYAKASPLKDVA